MRIYYSLLTILTISFFFSLSILFSNNSNLSSLIFISYYSNLNYSLQLSLILSSLPLLWDIIRNIYQHTLKAFHVATSLFIFSSLYDILLLTTHSNAIFGFLFTYREIAFLIGLFSLIYHHRNNVNLHYTSIIGAFLWIFGFISGTLTCSETKEKESFLSIPFIPILISLILTTYDYFRFLCDQRIHPEKYKHKSKPPPSIQNNTSTQTLHSDYSAIIFIFTILLGCSHLYFFTTIYIPSINITSTNFKNINNQHLPILIKSCVNLVIISYANIYPYLMAYRDMEVAILEQKDFYRNLGHEIRTPLNTALIGLQLIQEVITTKPAHLVLPVPKQPAFIEKIKDKKSRSVPHEVRHYIHPDLVQEYLRLRVESQLLNKSRFKGSQCTNGSSGAEVQSSSANAIVSLEVPRDSRNSSPSISRNSSTGALHDGDPSDLINITNITNNTNNNFLKHYQTPHLQLNMLHHNSGFHQTINESYSSHQTEREKLNEESTIEEITPYVDDVLSSCETAIEVLNEMLLFETLRSGDISHEFKPCPLLKLIIDPLSHFRIQALSKDVTLTLPDAKDFQGELRHFHKQLRAIVDINKFSKVLRNLVSNAIKFTPSQGKVTVHLELTKTSTLPTDWLEGNVENVWKYAKARSDIHRAVSEAGLQLYGYVKINVTDSGVGLSAENQKRLFQEIIQIQPNKNQGGQGSGLGLYISAELVRLHNGYYTVTSPGEGFGSTFSVYLPMYILNEYSLNSARSNDSEFIRGGSIRQRLAVLRDQDFQNVGSLSYRDIEEGGNLNNNNSQNNNNNSNSNSNVIYNGNSSDNVGSIHHSNRSTVSTDLNKNRQKRDSDVSSSPKSLREFKKMNSTIYPTNVSDEEQDVVIKSSSVNPSNTSIDSSLSINFTEVSTVSKSNSVIYTQNEKSWNVLIVDDAATNRKIMSRFLKIRGMKVDEADGGLSAIRMCSAFLSQNSTKPMTSTSLNDFLSPITNQYNLIFLDHDMPDMNGPETARMLLDMGYKGHLIGLTGHTEGLHHERFRECGVSRILIKPISVGLLDELFAG